MSLKKQDLKSGAILPAYFDHKGKKNFKGMVKLIKIDYPVNHDMMSIYFIKDSLDKTYPKHRVGGNVYIDVNGKQEIAEIIKVGVNQIKLSCNGEELLCEKPYSFIECFDIGDTIRTEHDNYYKTHVIIDDCKEFSVVTTQKQYENAQGEYGALIESGTVLNKPFDFIRDDSEIQSAIYKEERWLVEYLENPFVGSLKNGDTVYYRDRGQFKIYKSGFKLKVYKINPCNPMDVEYIECTPQDLFIEKENMRKGHAWFSYYYSRSNVLLFRTKEKSYDNMTISDFWEDQIETFDEY